MFENCCVKCSPFKVDLLVLGYEEVTPGSFPKVFGSPRVAAKVPDLRISAGVI
jgi:hypothetical protein